MKPGFHQDATIFGYVGPDLFAGPFPIPEEPEILEDWLFRYTCRGDTANISLMQNGAPFVSWLAKRVAP